MAPPKKKRPRDINVLAKFDARPELYPGGIEAMRRRFRDNPPTG